LFSTLSYYYGIAPPELSKTPLATIRAYSERLPARLAEMKLMLAECILLPYEDESLRRSTLARWQAEAGQGDVTPAANPFVLAMYGIGEEWVN
jgi:hypothetical protein